MQTENTNSHALVLTPAQAATALNIPARTLENWRATGSGPRFLKLGRRVAYRMCDLQAFLESRLRQHTGHTGDARHKRAGA